MRKMLKHDLRSVWRVWRIMAPILLVSAILCGLVMPLSKYFGFETYNILDLFAMQFIPVLGLIASVIQLAANPMAWFAAQIMSMLPVVFFVITLILILIRYYKNFFTDEGYLTFTLPVSRTKLLNSKIIMAFFWMAMTAIVCFIAYVLYWLCTTDIEYWREVISEFANSGSDVTDDNMPKTDWLEFWSAISFISGFLVNSAMSVVCNFMVMLTSITVGATIVKRAKLMMGMGIYVAASFIMTCISFTVLFISMHYLSGTTAAEHFVSSAFLWLGATVFAGLCVVAYLINKKLINKHLNLP